MLSGDMRETQREWMAPWKQNRGSFKGQKLTISNDAKNKVRVKRRTYLILGFVKG